MTYNKKFSGRSNNSSNYRSAPVSKVARVYRNWSNLQLAIFDEIANGTGNLHISALAGTGKTSTIVESFYHVKPGNTCLMVAFGKAIQEELATKAPDAVTVLTFHAMGLRAITRAFGRVNVDSEKLRGYVRAEMGEKPETAEARSNMEKLISLAKGYMANDSNSVVDVMIKHDIDSTEKYSESEFADLCLKIMSATKNDHSRVDFDDMVWLPLVLNLSICQYDVVFIDEAQDLNPAQIELALRSCKRTGRVVSVGDVNQAIYAFRGADERAIPNILERMNSKVLPLSVTYRCGKKIVEEAKQYVPAYTAADGNPEGSVLSMNRESMMKAAQPGDFILSRTNAPMISICMQFLKEGRRANIAGRDVGKTLSSLVKKSKATDVDDFLVWLQTWKDREIARFAKMEKTQAIEAVEDKVLCLESLCEGSSSIKEIMENIDNLFKDGDDSSRIVLSSTHKAKGLERKRVFILSDTYRSGKNRSGKNQEETNLLYVAITRAKETLVYVSK